MDRKAARERLQGEGWLSLTPTEFAAAVLDRSTWKSLKAGDYLYAAGDPPGGIFGVAEGSIGFVSALGRPDSPMVHVARAVWWTGLGPLLSEQPRRASVVATAPVLAVYVSLPVLKDLLAVRPEWWRHIAFELLMEFDLATNTANDLMIRSAMQRCAATLLRLARNRFDDRGDAELTISQEELADMTNLSRSSVSTILAGLVERGLIASRYRAIHLLDIEALRRMSDGD